MDEIEKMKSKIAGCLCYEYQGNPDEDHEEMWINKGQKYEVAYAIAKCLKDCDAYWVVKRPECIRLLEETIQNMDHDGRRCCKRDEAYVELKNQINSKKYLWLLISSSQKV